MHEKKLLYAKKNYQKMLNDSIQTLSQIYQNKNKNSSCPCNLHIVSTPTA